MKKTKEKQSAAPDWKMIAGEMYARLKMAVTSLKAKDDSGGFIIDMDTGKETHWKDYFADAMELIPGVKINREVMHAYSLPRKQREKFFADLEKKAELKTLTP